VERARERARSRHLHPCRPAVDRREAEADEIARRAAARTGGEADVRREVGSLLGRDFSGVRVRPGAADLEAEGAGAETRGDEVRVAPGYWQPDVPLGRALLAHELTHVAQQGAAPPLGRAQGGWGPGPGGYRSALDAVRAERPSAALAARGATLTDPVAAGLTAAPRGMRQRTVGGNPRRAEDWSFTPAEYGALEQGGGSLSFAPGSDWMPEALRKNLQATLEKVLDPALTPAVTEGVNVRDFYHGHVAVPNGAIPADTSAALAAYSAEEEKRYTEVLGSTVGDVTKKNLKDFRKALEGLQPLLTQVLTPVLKVKGAAVIYHTFEWSGPEMKAGDPRRNWKTPLDTNVPESFSPPDPDDAGSYERDYDPVFQFAFLVDRQGQIHVRPGSIPELRTVTGEPGGI